MVLHHELTVPVGRLHHSGKLKVHVPVRKIVHCRTHDLQQSLMCKLGRATQNFQATEGAVLVRNAREESPFEVVSVTSYSVSPHRWGVMNPGQRCLAHCLPSCATACEGSVMQLMYLMSAAWLCR